MIKNEYIHSILKHVQKKQSDKKVWSIGLNTVWIPFFTASNINGETEITPDALGYPLRLQYDKNTGSVKFSKGKPIIRVARELADAVSMARLNFEANCLQYATDTAKDNPDAFKKHQALCAKMGTPLRQHDNEELTKALVNMPKPETPKTDVIAQAENVIKAKAPKAKAPKAKAPKAPVSTETPAPPASTETPASTKEAVTVS